MSKKIVINKETFTCTKKKIKSLLKNKGLELSLSEVANLLSQSFGYKNEFDMQNNYFKIVDKKTNKIEEEHSEIIESIYTEKTPEGYIRHKSPEEIKISLKNNIYKIKSYKTDQIICLDVKMKRFNVSQLYNGLLNNFMYYIVKDINDNYLPSNINGNIIISGATGSGRTYFANKISSLRKGFISLEKLKDDIYSEEEITDFKDLDIFLNKNDNNIIASIHSGGCMQVIESMKEMCQQSDFLIREEQIKSKIKCIINVRRV